MIKDLARKLRKNQWSTEQIFWHRVRKRQIDGHQFRRQFVLGKYIVDFICLKSRLIIELDGMQHDEHKEYDEKRDQWLRGEGFRILRFKNYEVKRDMDYVINRIRKCLE